MILIDKIKEIAPKILPTVGLIGIGFAVGWILHPKDKITEQTVKTVEVEKQVVVTQEKVRIEVVHVKDTQVVEKWHREKTEEHQKDGSWSSKEVDDKNVDTVVHEKENNTQVQVVTVEKQVVVEKEKLVETKSALPNWHVGILVGTAPRFDSPIDTPLLVGVEAERRIVGPVFAGLWAMGGSPVVGPFKLVNASVGLKVGVEW